MTRGVDVVDLLAGIRELLVEHGSLEAAYENVEGDHLARASVRAFPSR